MVQAPCRDTAVTGRPAGKREASNATKDDAVLSVLARAGGGPLTLKQIVAAIQGRPWVAVKRGAAESALDRLIKEGHVVKADDSRAHLYFLSRTGG